ncbi:phosphohistidine phosphatase SixA [Microbulbifer agarilyticus]|uniref:phosphohistidine phosphatase SixA n=1 Tax=Microbulbifer agarilyticus TaxID=260552 RepID=UPI001C9654F9|nr:phosphohistidine phosphatase SixA [Microbulbifer agarilyticus]MBY6191926.1 phosphohistidine phosphatase SixA [Microbulbifer agarilyticus]MBY6213115.1 phosphohistidine phosphatase SixA [Microbulbifer agarilyticus]MCA0894851.1 phosphohistidine phosphatase SixA [Microbulbifer agarilyticus]
MLLFVMRHGRAEPFSKSDETRALTEDGREQVAAVCKERASELAQVKTIWASPFVRTRQTAKIVADTFDLPVEINEVLTGDTPAQAVLDALAEVDEKDYPVLLVSHQPLVGTLVNRLCGSAEELPMGTSSLACLSADVWAWDCAELEWLQHKP